MFQDQRVFGRPESAGLGGPVPLVHIDDMGITSQRVRNEAEAGYARGGVQGAGHQTTVDLKHAAQLLSGVHVLTRIRDGRSGRPPCLTLIPGR